MSEGQAMIKTIDVDGIAQRYHVHGSGPVCVAHSGGPGIGWEYLRMPALEEQLTMVYVEPVGTGESGRLADPAGYHVDTYARFMHAIIEDLGQPRVALLGHSHGGIVVQHYALTHPDRVAGLTLYSTSAVYEENFWRDAAANLQRFAEKHGRPEMIEAFGRPFRELDDDSWAGVLRTIFPAYFADYWAREQDFEPLRAGFQAWQAPMRGVEPVPFDVREQLRGTTVPALIVYGHHDYICGPKWGTILSDVLPHARVLDLADGGHFAHLEKPDVFYPAVAAFVTKSLS
jgi:pimeloyl-ACP methyl ester carboxylesterase